jgi:hypothetical protein
VQWAAHQCGLRDERNVVGKPIQRNHDDEFENRCVFVPHQAQLHERRIAAFNHIARES